MPVGFSRGTFAPGRGLFSPPCGVLCSAGTDRGSAVVRPGVDDDPGRHAAECLTRGEHQKRVPREREREREGRRKDGGREGETVLVYTLSM